MKTRALLLALPLLALAGCTVEDRTTVRVSSICMPGDAEACSFSNTCEGVPLGNLFIDVGSADSLITFFQVNNQLPSNENPDEYELNSNDAWLREYTIEYEGIPVPPRTARIPASSSLVPTAGSTVVEIATLHDQDVPIFLDPAFVFPATGYLDAVAHLTVRGVYAHGDEFESGEFDVAFRVCEPGACGFGFIACTAPDLDVFCPQFGQWPATHACVTP